MRFRSHHEIRHAASEAVIWHRENMLYLEEDVNIDFVGFMSALFDHADELALSRQGTGLMPSERNLKHLTAPGESIPNALGLPEFPSHRERDEN